MDRLVAWRVNHLSAARAGSVRNRARLDRPDYRAVVAADNEHFFDNRFPGERVDSQLPLVFQMRNDVRVPFVPDLDAIVFEPDGDFGESRMPVDAADESRHFVVFYLAVEDSSQVRVNALRHQILGDDHRLFIATRYLLAQWVVLQKTFRRGVESVCLQRLPELIHILGQCGICQCRIAFEKLVIGATRISSSSLNQDIDEVV